jgi:signal transduction histidine kinase
VKSIAENIEANSDKINHHGRRADSIVKGMLQHSRGSSAQKELTDINKLADEYFRLAFTGHRAKNKSFNVGLEKNFEASLPEINVVPQDIGRVLLNLINNAFYSVTERAHKEKPEYKPVVSLSTEKVDNKIEVRIKDNGTGISKNVLQKIFQPFFTTKPTGQGTGLGLSVSYDIIKAHGGELRVETTEGQGSEFVILLPHQ